MSKTNMSDYGLDTLGEAYGFWSYAHKIDELKETMIPFLESRIPLFFNGKFARQWFKDTFAEQFLAIHTDYADSGIKFHVHYLVFDLDFYINHYHASANMMNHIPIIIYETGVVDIGDKMNCLGKVFSSDEL